MNPAEFNAIHREIASITDELNELRGLAQTRTGAELNARKQAYRRLMKELRQLVHRLYQSRRLYQSQPQL